MWAILLDTNDQMTRDWYHKWYQRTKGWLPKDREVEDGWNSWRELRGTSFPSWSKSHKHNIQQKNMVNIVWSDAIQHIIDSLDMNLGKLGLTKSQIQLGDWTTTTKTVWRQMLLDLPWWSLHNVFKHYTCETNILLNVHQLYLNQ